jgi:hypothetical protein
MVLFFIGPGLTFPYLARLYIASSDNIWDWEVGTNLSLSRQGSHLAALSAEGEELGGAGMDKKDFLQCPCSVHPGSA